MERVVLSGAFDHAPPPFGVERWSLVVDAVPVAAGQVTLPMFEHAQQQAAAFGEEGFRLTEVDELGRTKATRRIRYTPQQQSFVNLDTGVVSRLVSAPAPHRRSP